MENVKVSIQVVKHQIIKMENVLAVTLDIKFNMVHAFSALFKIKIYFVIVTISMGFAINAQLDIILITIKYV